MQGGAVLLIFFCKSANAANRLLDGNLLINKTGWISDAAGTHVFANIYLQSHTWEDNTTSNQLPDHLNRSEK